MNKKILFYTSILCFACLTACQQLFVQQRENLVRLGVVREIGVDYVRVSGVLLDVADKDGNPLQTFGHCWSASNQAPTLDDLSNNLGKTENFGDFFTTMRDLTIEATYYVRAYAESTEGVEYSDESFEIIPGLVRTTVVFNISSIDAIAEGTISDLANFDTYGHCWAKTVPSIQDTKTTYSSIPIEPFISEITGLEPNSTYYVRSYMIDSNGIPNYGDLIEFQTGSE